jgi:hypothetical protein
MQSKLILMLSGLTAGAALAACDSAPTMSIVSSTVPVGEDIVVTFDPAIEGRAANLYWITLQPVDAPDSSSSGRIVVEHGLTRARVRATEPGTFEVRLHDRYPQKEDHLVARAPVRVLAKRDQSDAPPVARAPASEKECLDRWLAAQKLDAYGSPEGSVYANLSPLFDRSSKQMTPRITYLYAKFPSAKAACASRPGAPESDVRAPDEQARPIETPPQHP